MSGIKVVSEQDVIKLLNHWKTVQQEYPLDLLVNQRVHFSEMVNARIHGVSVSPHHAEVADALPTPVANSLIVVLVTTSIAISAYLGLSIYRNWDLLMDMLRGTPAPLVVPPSPVSTPTFESTPTETPTATATPSMTPSPTGSATEELNETDINDEPDDDTGKHLGQTPHAPKTPPSGQDK